MTTNQILTFIAHAKGRRKVGAAIVMKCIIVATDGSPGANRAVDAAASFAKTIGAELTILTVGGDISGEQLRRLASIDGDLSKTLESASKQILNQAARRAQRLGIAKPTLRSEWGDPAETIIDAIRREKADLVVVGRRGRGQLTGLLLGSVSQKIASLAKCIVVVVP